MSKGKKLPTWLQVSIVWFVLSVLLLCGLMYLRATEILSDRIFQPFGILLCHEGEHLETSYRSSTPTFLRTGEAPKRSGPTLKSAVCVSESGAKRSAKGLLLILWIAIAVPLALILFPSLMRKPRKKEKKM